MNININFMITAQKLNELIKKKENIIIIDVRDVEEYSNGHIINAVNFPEIFTYLPEGMTTEEEKEDFISFYKDVFSKAGVSSNDTVILYENKYTLMSPRGLLILKYLGHDEEKIKVLDGGYHSWCTNNFETTSEFLKNKSKEFIPNINENFFVDYNEMLNIIKDDSIIKLDVRDKDEWIGISSSPYGINFAPKKGRIPNSVWIEWYDFITEDMLSVASLDKIQIELNKKAIKENDNIVLYCFKGARIANSYIALRKLGYENIRIYFAGWNEWCRKDNAPIINEVENNDNPILQENILLKNKLDELNLKQANLIDFPKYNKEPIFAFTREGEICSANEAKKEHLSHITKIQDIIIDFTKKDIYNMIDNNQEKNLTIYVKDKYYSTQLRGSRNSNKILVYCFDTTEINHLNNSLQTHYNIMDNIGAYVFTKDLNHKFTYVNSLVRDLFNCPMDEIIGFDDSKFFSAESLASIRKADRFVLEEGKTIESEEKNILKETGEISFFMAVKKPLFDNKGHIIGMFGVSTDITKRKLLEDKFAEKTHLLNTILNNIDAHIYMKDNQYKYRYINPKTEKLFGLKASDIIGKTDSEIMSKELADNFREADERIFETGITQSKEESFINKKGETLYYWSIKVPLKNSDRKVQSYIGFSTDITELIKLRSELQLQVKKEIKERKKQEQLAITDKLTGLYNRIKIDETLEFELSRMNRSSSTFSIVIIDIDFFKKVNDNYGHMIGDKVLISMSKILKKYSRSTDIIGRWGGEEFIIICPITNSLGIKKLATKLCYEINHYEFPNVKNITASFGITTYIKNDTIDSILERADKALYKAKSNGRNKVESN